MNKVQEMIRKLNNNKIIQNRVYIQEEEKEYKSNLIKIKEKVEHSLNDGGTYFTIKGIEEKQFTQEFFRNIEQYVYGTSSPLYSVEITKDGLKKLYSKINKYKLEE